LKRTIDLAQRLARLSPEDPELMPELGPQTYSAVNAYVSSTADLDPETRASAVQRAVTAATANGKPAGTIFSAGFLDATARATAVATSNGLFAYHRSTDAEFSMTARTPDGTGSGWASAGARDWSALDPAAIGRIAAQKAVASRNPQAIEPGMYTAVLEPHAVTALVPLPARSTRATPTKGAARFRNPAAAIGSARRSSTSA
jgi:predicted Zn-dependent protease